MYFYPEWPIFGLCILCDSLQVALFIFLLAGLWKEELLFPFPSLLPSVLSHLPKRSAPISAPRDTERLWQARLFLEVCPHSFPAGKESRKTNPSGRGGGSFTRRSPLGAWAVVVLIICYLVSRDRRGLHFAWRWSPALKLCMNPSVPYGKSRRLKYSMELHGWCPVMSYISHVSELLLQNQKYYCLSPRSRNRSSEFGS